MDDQERYRLRVTHHDPGGECKSIVDTICNERPAVGEEKLGGVKATTLAWVDDDGFRRELKFPSGSRWECILETLED